MIITSYLRVLLACVRCAFTWHAQAHHHHPHSLHFPFGYIESSFVDSIKFLFGQFLRGWLEYFEGALVPLASYDFLDGRIATLVGRLHFTADGIFVIDRHTCTEDLLRTHLHLAAFVCTP